MVDAQPVPQAGTLFLDKPDLQGAYGQAIAVDRVLFHRRTPYQEIFIIEAGLLGRLLILDGNINVCEFDEAAYHEMLVHVPLLAHPHPEQVLVIGGGDGGALREIAKHPGVKHIDICEIDQEVIDACRHYLPSVGRGFDDPRVKVHIGDGARFAAGVQNAYDVILVDASDPDPGTPGEELFRREFFASLKRALRPGGMIVSQMESFYLYEPLIRQTFAFLSETFHRAHYYLTLVPTYLSGVIGFACCSLGPDPMGLPDRRRLESLEPITYYNAAVHRAAFALPQRCLRLLPLKVASGQGVMP